MGRSPCCAKEGMNRGAWTAIEDKLLVDYISKNGEGRWRSIPKEAGLKRCGKSCRLRWLNYLRPDIKRGNITHDEEDLIIRLHKLLGNRWSLIAGRLPGRTDNEIKNYWNTTLLKKIQGGDQCPSPSERSTKKRPNRVTPSKTEATNKAVRTKAVRCNKVVMITPQPQLPFKNAGGNEEYGIKKIFATNERGYNWNNASENECVSLASNTSPTTSGEDYSALESIPIELCGAFAPGEDPLGNGSDPDFWSMLNDWIMDEDADCHS